ncbi:hypothetical protein TRIP_B50090 [uncultured Desulfatiglans sp.]|nr:hypothetical protein TRIP_B50090 [uncultured Desulfatiglans sp.]
MKNDDQETGLFRGAARPAAFGARMLFGETGLEESMQRLTGQGSEHGVRVYLVREARQDGNHHLEPPTGSQCDEPAALAGCTGGAPGRGERRRRQGPRHHRQRPGLFDRGGSQGVEGP